MSKKNVLKITLFVFSGLFLVLAFQNCKMVEDAENNLNSKSSLYCEQDGERYPIGAQLSAADSCNACSCESSGNGAYIMCTAIACADEPSTSISICLHNNMSYFGGDQFKSADGCNTCTCETDGSVSCTEKACNKPTTCKVGDHEYLPGESYNDDCNLCVCADSGMSMCTMMACIE